MKKYPRVYHTQFSPKTSHPLHRRSRSGMTWVVVSAFCAATLFCLVILARAAWAGGGAPAPAGKQNHPPKVQPAPTRSAGIINMHQGPFLSSVFTVRNFWQGPVGSAWTLAYAGAKTNVDGTAGSGGIVLYIETADSQGNFDLHPLGTFLVPDGSTALTILAENGNLLMLRSDSGRRFAFNLQTHQFR